MIQITIGRDTKAGDEASVQWLHSTIDSRRSDGVDSSVLVRIEAEGVDLYLRAPARPGRGEPRQLSKAEEFILERWNALGLSDAEFSVDSLYAFLRTMRGFS